MRAPTNASRVRAFKRGLSTTRTPCLAVSRRAQGVCRAFAPDTEGHTEEHVEGYTIETKFCEAPTASGSGRTLSPKCREAETEEWALYAAALDACSMSHARKTAELEHAVKSENYSLAAALKTEVHALEQGNVLANLHARQADAVGADDFETAAVLRDAASHNLTGWWAATNTGSDPWSHVVRVSEGYSRLEARVYSPTHLADTMGWGHETPYHQPYGNKSYDETGVPFFEVVFRRDQAGELQQKHFVKLDGIEAGTPLGHSICGASVELEAAAPEVAPTPPPPPPSPLPLATGPLRLPKHPVDFWNLLVNRRNRGAGASTSYEGPQSAAAAAPPPGPHKLSTLKGQLAPRRAEAKSPTLREAYAKVQEMDALAALADLEERASGARLPGSPDDVAQVERLPCSVTLVDRNHFRLSMPALGTGAPRTIEYTRIEHDMPPTDPLTGYYLGSFGAHGPELLLLQRGIVDGEEAIIAHKVTGDPNVPAGQVSFRAKVGPKHALDVHAYPSALNVSKRFGGEGCVAERGFVKSRWAKGELLSFGGSSKLQRLTGNAELGFIWSMAHSKRFLILLSRVNFV